LSIDQAIVRPQRDGENLPDTMGIEIDAEEPNFDAPFNSFLIVNGTRPLFSTVRSSILQTPRNNLVIEDTRISRLHAQLRVIRGQFVIFDLGSTGGTWVNNNQVSQALFFREM